MQRSFTFVLLLVVCLICIGPLAAQVEPSVIVTPYEDNPILSAGEPGTWDAGGVGWPRVIVQDGLFHMLYSGWTEGSLPYTAIGYATSSDGLTWTKYAENPVFALDQRTARTGVLGALPILVDDTWVLYFTGSTEMARPSRTVQRATAPSPTGPWTIEPEPVLELGTARDWDGFGGFTVDSVLKTPDGYVMYYTLLRSPTLDGPSYLSGGVGRATSPDGVHWTKYDDPSTSSGLFTASDPVFMGTQDYKNWDPLGVGIPVVQQSGDQWEMYYAGMGSGYWKIGHSISQDGIVWPHEEAPVLTEEVHGMAPGSVIVTDDAEYFYYADWPAVEDVIKIMVATISHP